MTQKGRPNKSGKTNQADRGSKSNNFETNTKTEDLALAESAFMVNNKEETKDITKEEAKDVQVFENGVTTIDFMMPEEERKILEKNLNVYGNVEKMKKVLSVAKQTKVLQEDVETLNQISKADAVINNMYDVLNNPNNVEMINQYIQQKLENGQDVAKAYKEIGLMTKAMTDAREGMVNRIKHRNTGKTTRIALKFTNDSGQEFNLGVETDGQQ